MKKLSITHIASTLIFLGIFFIPFNSWEGVGFLGEFYRDSCFLFFSIAFMFLVFKRKIKIPYQNIIFQFLILLIIWSLVATILNSSNILEYFFKKTTGVERFINQYGALIICTILLPITFYNAFFTLDINKLFFRIRKILLASLTIVLAYAFIEVLIVKFGMVDLKIKVLNIFDYFPFTEAKIDPRSSRISSVSFEAPALGTYLLSISGWMFSYIITSNSKWKYIPTIIVVVLAFLSGSRAAFFITIIQALIFIAILLRNTRHSKTFLKTSFSFMVVSFVLFGVYSKEITGYVKNEIQSFKLDDKQHANSNKSRFGIQQAMLKVFLENPVAGTGYGLQAFESRKYYPVWAKRNNWEFRVMYLNQNDERFPPGYNIYLRFLSETGLVGFLIFCGLLIQVFLWCYNNFNKHNLYSIVILISMIGFSMNWLKMDSLRIYAFWLCLALIFLMESKKLKNA
jgi:O-antigen ligase